jgi:hypothetical protein
MPVAIPRNWLLNVPRSSDPEAVRLCEALERRKCADLVPTFTRESNDLVFVVHIDQLCQHAPELVARVVALVNSRVPGVRCEGVDESALIEGLLRVIAVLDQPVPANEPPPSSGLVARKAIAQAFGVSVRTLKAYADIPGFPTPVRWKGCVYFIGMAVASWAKANGRAFDDGSLHGDAERDRKSTPPTNGDGTRA